MTGKFLPTASVSNLRFRSRLLSELRRFFDQRGFWEVETPLVSVDTVIDRFMEPISVSVQDKQFWLQTSPEFGMKRLLSAGSGSIYQVTRAFRNAEVGPLHNPEFTIVEWYGVDQSYDEGMHLLADLAGEVLGSDDVDRITYEQAFRDFAGIDPHHAAIDQFADCARRNQINVPESLDQTDRDEWLNLLLAETVEPALGTKRPVILCDYPASQSALARIDNRRPHVAQRFELYYQGIELANGYHELLDPAELRNRNQSNNAHRKKNRRICLPENSFLLEAMEHGLPPCTGVALGFDRLVMLVVGAEEISEVMGFPLDRA